jgi:hypothetical protein
LDEEVVALLNIESAEEGLVGASLHNQTTWPKELPQARAAQDVQTDDHRTWRDELFRPEHAEQRKYNETCRERC